MECRGATHAVEVVLLTPRQAGERLGCSPSHVRRLIARGELRVVDIARAGSTRTKLRVRSDDLGRYVDNLTAGPAS